MKALRTIGERLRAHFPESADKLTETSGATAAHGMMGDLLKPLGMAAQVGGVPRRGRRQHRPGHVPLRMTRAGVNDRELGHARGLRGTRDSSTDR